MKLELLQKPDYALVKTTFEEAGESLIAEGGAMVARSTELTMKTSMRGGFLAAAKRKLLGGESLFLNTFTATAPGQTLYLAPPPEGDVLTHELGGAEPLFVQSGAFLAATSGVTLDTKWGGAKGFFGAGLFLLKAEGRGSILLSAFGGLHPVDVGPEGFIADNANIIAFTSGLDYDVRRIGGMKGLFFSGEGLVCHFRGQGRVYLQTRNPQSFAAWVHPFRRVKSSN